MLPLNSRRAIAARLAPALVVIGLLLLALALDESQRTQGASQPARPASQLRQSLPSLDTAGAPGTEITAQVATLEPAPTAAAPATLAATEAAPTATPVRPTPTPRAEVEAAAAPVLAASTSAALSGDPAGELMALLNQYRATNGLRPLTPNSNLTAAAAGYARYMADANFFGHYGPNGSTPVSRMAAAGYPGTYCSGCGEVLNAGQRSPVASLNDWLASPPHAGIILSAGAVDVGVGYAFSAGSHYGHYWVLITGLR